MAINIKFDSAGNPEPPTIVLAKRNGDKLGQLKVDPKSIELNDKFNDASEISFTLYKYTDGKLTNLWDDVVDFKLIHCKEWDMWFEIKVELDEETETIKTVFCTQLGQAELSQLMLYDIHINEEGDSNWNIENKNTILYNPDDTGTSLLHRLLKDKAPHYSILKVDDTIKNIQRTFSFDGTSIYDAFMEIAEEIGCLFIFHSNSDENGKIQRTISVYDLQQNCLNPDCMHRGEFTDTCPKCGGKNEKGEQFGIKDGYGTDTTIFVTADELASGGIQLTTDTDSVKNCFKLEAGDDLMTATIRNCNPNGTDYIWYFSDDMKADMSKELVAALSDYDAEYKKYYNVHASNVDMSAYNILVERYADKYNANSVRCLSCGHKGNFKNVCPECGSNNLLVGDRLESIDNSIVGYPALMNAYYNVIDLGLYLKSGLMPSVDITDDLKAEDYVAMLTSEALSPIAVNVEKIDYASLSTADSAVESMAKIIVKSTYKVETEASSLSDQKVWTGRIKITNYSDEDDTATTDILTIAIVKNDEVLAQQRIDKAMSKLDADDLSISGLIAKEIKLDENGEHIESEDGICECEFCKELKNYALNPLQSFHDACEECLTILQDQGAGNKETNLDLYNKLYNPYLKKQAAIAKEIKIREEEVDSICGVYEENDDGERVLATDGKRLQQYIEDCKNEIQKALNFQKYLENKNEEINLWLEFCTYRREDKYSNENYISDGLNNTELFKRAAKFVEVAQDEIFKSAELQHSISTSLNNLLAIPKFEKLVEYFNVGNWIRVQIDEQICKLRLLEYDISFGGFITIPVEFSDVIKIKNGITDVQDVLAQASSMATSYSSVKKQASQGEESNTVIKNWFSNGLDATNTKIVGNANNQNQVWGKNGILCREYNPIMDTYSDEQLKIINSTIAVTDDGWNTTKTAIGKFHYFDPANNYTLSTAYGINAELVVGKMLLGESLGLYNEDNSMKFDTNGLVVSYTNKDTNISNTISINPNPETNGNSLLTAYKNDTPTLTFDENGDLIIVGNIKAKSLTLDPDVEISVEDKNGNIVKDVYIKVDKEVGDTPSENTTGTLIGKDGSLTASNAIIYGTLYSSEGRIGGAIIADSVIESENFEFSEDNYTSSKSGLRLDLDPSNVGIYTPHTTIKDDYVSINGKLIVGNGDGSGYGSISVGVSESSGKYSLAQGEETVAYGVGSFASGFRNDAMGEYSFTIGALNKASTNNQFVAGKCNINDAEGKYAVIIGNGSYYESDPDPYRESQRVTLSNAFTLDWDGNGWFAGDIYTVNGLISASDRNLKKNIQNLDNKYIKLFDLINPVSYEMIDGNRTHIGFIAQDVEEAIEQVGLTSLDFGGLCKDIKTTTDENGNEIAVLDENGNKVEAYSLRYNEFIALNTAKIKQLEQLILQLQDEINELKSK